MLAFEVILVKLHPPHAGQSLSQEKGKGVWYSHEQMNHPIEPKLRTVLGDTVDELLCEFDGVTTALNAC